MNMADPARDEAMNKAKELLRREAYAEAEALLLHLIQDMESRLGRDAPELIDPLYLYARSVSKQRVWNILPTRERAALERALELAVRLHGEESPRTKKLRENFAVCLNAAGEAALAAAHMAIVVRIAERVHGEGVLLAFALAGLANILFDLKRFEEAASLYERAFKMAGGRGDEVMDFGLLYGQGRCLVEMNRCVDAISFLERAHCSCVQRFGERNRITEEVKGWLERAQQISCAGQEK